MPSDVSTDHSAAASWKEIWQSDQFARFMVLCFGVWLHAADFALVATLLPDAVIEIGGTHLLNWNVSLFQLGSIIAGAATGLLVMRMGLAHALVGGAVIYIIGCAISAMAPTMEVILIGRLLQGLGGGFLVALVIVSVNDLFPSRMAPRAFAIVSVVWGASSFIGPLIGGVFAEAGYWRAGFWAFGAQGIVFIAAVLLVLRDANTVKAADTRLPYRRLVLLSLSILAISWAGAVAEQGGGGWETPVYATIGLFMLVLFFWQDGRAGHNRLFPRGGGNIRKSTGAGIILVLLLAMVTVPFYAYGPLLLKIIYGVGPLMAGYILATGSIAWTVGALVFSGTNRAHEGKVILGGATVILISIIGLAFVVPSAGIWAIIPFLFLEGAGFGMAFAFIVRRVVESVKEDDKERAAAAVSTGQEMGYAVGAAAIGIIANIAGFAEGISLEAAQISGFWLFAAFVPLAMIAVFAAWQLAYGETTKGEPVHEQA